MSSFGNTGVSSLLSSATAAYNRNQAYQDSVASYNYELSNKDEAAYNTYSSYLAGRSTQTQNDPTANLTIQKALSSAAKSYTSAEINRASLSVDYGDIDNSQKLQIVSQLRDAALQNGDDATAQSLESKMASLQITIGNQQESAARAGEAATKAGQTANKTAVNDTASKYDQQLKLANEAVARGQMSVQDYQKLQGEALSGKAQLYQDAADGKYGDLGDSQSDFLEKANGVTTSSQYLDAQKYYSQATNGQPTKYLQVNPANRDAQGMIGDLKDLPGSKIVQNPDGSFSNQYLGGFNGLEGAGAKDTADARLKGAQSGKDFIFNNVVQAGQAKGTGGTLTPIGSQMIADPANPGQYYVMDQNGNKHYVALDPNSTLQRSQTPITKDDANAGKKPGILGQAGNFLTNDYNTYKGGIGAIANGLGSSPVGKVLGGIGNGVSNLLGFNQHQQDLVKAQQALAAAKQAQASIAAAQQAQQRIASQNATAALQRHVTTIPVQPKTVTDVHQIFNAAPKGATPQQTVVNQISRAIDGGIAANAKSPAPAPAPKPSFSLFHPSTWF